MNAFIVVPAHNEQGSVGTVVHEAKKHSRHVVVVDDGSLDQTALAARKAGADVLQHLVNLGKGAALKTGCDYAVRKGADAIVVMDADRQHQAKDISRLLEALKGKDIVFTYRQFSGDMPLVLRFGNGFIQLVAEILFGIRIRDTQCGYRAFTTEAYRKIRWVSNDYSVESEMIARAGKKRLRFTQVPIETVYMDRYKGTTPLDGMKIVLAMLWWRLSR